MCHHVRALVHSVASPIPATFADFPHTRTCKHPPTHTHTHSHTQTFSKFPALRANWLQLAQRDNRRKSKVKAEKKDRKKREKREGNSRVLKPAGFRWILSEEQIFHSVSQKLLQ